MKLRLGTARVGIDSGFLASWPSSQVEHVSTRLPDGFERNLNRIVLGQTDYTIQRTSTSGPTLSMHPIDLAQLMWQTH